MFLDTAEAGGVTPPDCLLERFYSVLLNSVVLLAETTVV